MSVKNRKAPKGILGFPVAPMDEEGKLDLNALGRNIEFLVEEGLSSVFVACGAGELHAISNEEYKSMVQVAVEKTKGKVPLYTGVGGNISHALEQAKISEELGAEGYLILPPYLINPSQDGIYNYLRTIIESTNLNAIVYQRDNCILELDTLQKLCELPQLVGYKDGVGNMEQNIEFIHEIGDRLEWINGMPLAEITMAAYINLRIYFLFIRYFKLYSTYFSKVLRCVVERK